MKSYVFVLSSYNFFLFFLGGWVVELNQMKVSSASNLEVWTKHGKKDNWNWAWCKCKFIVQFRAQKNFTKQRKSQPWNHIFFYTNRWPVMNNEIIIPLYQASPTTKNTKYIFFRDYKVMTEGIMVFYLYKVANPWLMICK